ncbi:MAG: hypothetical protein AAF662_04905 [Pseudomonadota bacterium]
MDSYKALKPLRRKSTPAAPIPKSGRFSYERIADRQREITENNLVAVADLLLEGL